MNTNTVRVESFESPYTVRTVPVAEAVKEFGKLELLEYCDGGNGNEVFFVEDRDGAPIYPVTEADLSVDRQA